MPLGGRRITCLLGCHAADGHRKLTYREAEDLIRYYAPAAYLCGLTETQWTPDFTTIQDFTQLMGEEGIKLINQYVVQMAVNRSWPTQDGSRRHDCPGMRRSLSNEMGLMTGFLTRGKCSPKGRPRLKDLWSRRPLDSKLQQKAREYRLFARPRRARTG